MRIWALLLSIASLSVAACASDSEDMPAGQGGASSGTGAGSGGSAGTVSGGAGGQSGAGGQAGAVGGTSGGTMGGAMASGGSGGSGGEMLDASADAMTGQDAQAPENPPLAEHVCGPGPFGDPLPPEGQRTASVVAGAQDGFVFLEGPVWLGEQGVLLFSDMDFGSANVAMGPPARIRRFTPPSSFDVFQEHGNSNGLALDVNGDVLACTHDLQTISRYDASTAERDTMLLTYGGLHFNSPNDLTVRSDGTIYFTDPSHQLGPRTSETGDTSVYRVTPSSEVELVTSMLNQPNGIALSLDEQTLYVATADADILGYPVHEDGSVGDSEVFAAGAGGTDGMTLDCAGNVYSTGSGKVQVWNANGDKLGEIAVPEGPSNVAFGGADRKTLFITAGSKLYSIALLVPGLPF